MSPFTRSSSFTRSAKASALSLKFLDPKMGLFTSLLIVPCFLFQGCTSRSFGTQSPRTSSASSVVLKDLPKVTDLPVSDYFDEVGDLALFKVPLSTDYLKDFAVCQYYPARCEIEDFKRGISGPVLGAVKQIDDQIKNDQATLVWVNSELAKPGITPTDKDYYDKYKADTEASIKALEAERVTAAATAAAKMKVIMPIVDAEAKIIDAAVSKGFDFFNAKTYSQIYLAESGRPSQRIAASVILKYMRKLRKETYVYPADGDLSDKGRAARIKFYNALRSWGGTAPADPGTTDIKGAATEELKQKIRDFQSYLKVKEIAKGNSEDRLHEGDWIPDLGDDQINGNLGATPPHWNDLQAHYYSATGHRRHGCYTSVHRAIQGIRDESKLPEIIKGDGPLKFATMRDSVIRFCTSESKELKTKSGADRQLNDWAVDQKLVEASLEELKKNTPENFEFYNLELAYATRQAFRRMWMGQIVSELKGQTNPATKRPYNAFDYVMLASVWSMNYDQQQAIINAFYHDLSNRFDESGSAKDKPDSTPVAPYEPGKDQGCSIRPARTYGQINRPLVCQFDQPREYQTHSIGR